MTETSDSVTITIGTEGFWGSDVPKGHGLVFAARVASLVLKRWPWPKVTTKVEKDREAIVVVTTAAIAEEIRAFVDSVKSDVIWDQVRDNEIQNAEVGAEIIEW